MIPDPSWELVGRAPVEDLGAAARQLQRAARWLSIAARHTIPPQLDGSHTALRWAPGLAALATGGIEPDPGPMPGLPFRLALRPADLALLEVDEMGRVMQAVPLDGCSDDDVGLWVADRLAARDLPAIHEDGGGRNRVASSPAEGRDPTLLALGDGLAFAELSRWFANAGLVLGAVAANSPGATPPRCWTDRFDLRTDVPTDATGGTVRAGFLAAGDGVDDEPCFYVASHPGAADETVAAVLPVSQVIERRDCTWQEQAVAAALRDGMARLVGG